MAKTKIVDGQNVSLSNISAQCELTSLNNGTFELTQDGKRFVICDLVGVAKEIPVLEDNDENIQAGNSANGEQEIKEGAQTTNKGKLDKNGDEILRAAEPLDNKQANEELKDDKKALEQNGFHVIGEDGYQSTKKSQNQSKKKLEIL